MSSSAVYRYFRSKDEIVEGTVDVVLARLRDRFRAMLEQPTRPTWPGCHDDLRRHEPRPVDRVL
jgi:AcrR family transcriptional regulator